MPRIAVFTKNRTNPAYEAARLGRRPDRGAARRHHHPLCPRAARQRAGADRADRARHRGAARRGGVRAGGRDRGQRRHPRLRAAGIPLFNIITRTTAGRRVTFVGSDDRALARNIARYLFGKLPRRSTIIILEGTPASATSRERLMGFQDALAEHPGINVRCSLRGDYQRDVAREVFLAPRINGRAWTRCYAPTTSWRSACWMRSLRTRAAGRWWSASTPSPRRSRRSRPGGCSPPPTSTPWR